MVDVRLFMIARERDVLQSHVLRRFVRFRYLCVELRNAECRQKTGSLVNL